jgi:hypothetical protein
MTERPDERRARAIVGAALGLQVERYEDGSAPGQVDAVIMDPKGLVPLEIVADHDNVFNAQWDALEEIHHTIHVPGLRSRWSVQIRHGARVKRLVTQLPGHLLNLQEQSVQVPARPRPVPPELTQLGVLMLYPLEGGPVGNVHLQTQGWSGSAGEGEPADWVELMLERHPDVVIKLDRFASHEKHAFLWMTIATDYSSQFRLERKQPPLPPPTLAPQLPRGVTHVWIAGSFNSQGCLAWFPDRGWWRVPAPPNGTDVVETP